MNKKTEKLIDKVKDLKPLEGRVLIVPDKVRTYKDKGLEGKPKDPNIKPEDIDAETEMVMEEVITDVNYRFQTGTVIQKAEDETRFEVGDTVIYQIGALKEFDLVKGVSILRKYDVEFVRAN